jgi:hypothetical protein
MDASITFTPNVTGVVKHFEGHVFVLTDMILICERMSSEEQAHRHDGADMWLSYPPFSGKDLRISQNHIQSELVMLFISYSPSNSDILRRHPAHFYLENFINKVAGRNSPETGPFTCGARALRRAQRYLGVFASF